MLDTYGMIVTTFSVVDKANWVRFFKETFLIANVSPEVVFGMLFCTLSGVNIDFSGQKLRWRIYTTKEAFPTTRYVELIGKKEFAATAFDLEYETYIVYIVFLNSTPLIVSLGSTPLNVYPFRRPQISDLIAKKALTKVSAKYSNFVDIFFLDLASKFPKHTRINDHTIELVDGY